MPDTLTYALMAGGAYFSTRDPVNRFPTPQGWNSDIKNTSPTGFEAVTFFNGTDIAHSSEIVISLNIRGQSELAQRRNVFKSLRPPIL